MSEMPMTTDTTDPTVATPASGAAGGAAPGGDTATPGAAGATAAKAASNGHEILLSVRDVTKYFDIRGGLLGVSKVASVRAVDGVSFDVRRGETLGLVGESGCGKTTLGKVVLGLIPATSGAVKFKDETLFDLPSPAQKKAGKKPYTIPGGKLKELRKDVQVVFQDPYASLNPRMTVGEIVGEGPLVHGLKDKRKREAVVRELLGKVGLNQSHIHRYPHEFSGGQRQRIGIARALAVNPDFVVCDEPVSALDVSIQSQVLNLLDDLQREFGLTYLFIAHNLAVVEHISDRVGVMYLGRMAELADVDDLYTNPRHPYTVALLSAIPNPDPRIRKKRLVLKGDIPSPANPPSGCRFHTRCWLRERLGNPENCATVDPDFRDIGGGHLVACHWAEEMSTVGREVKEAVGIAPRDPLAKNVPPASAPAPVPAADVEERIPAPPTGPQKDVPLT